MDNYILYKTNYKNNEIKFVDEILKTKKIEGTNIEMVFVKWLGSTEDKATWEIKRLLSLMPKN